MEIKNSQKVANIYTCFICDYYTSRKSSYDKHLLTSKHLQLIESSQKVANCFSCLICDYTTRKKNNYDKHLTTSKHIKLIESSQKTHQKVANSIECLNCDYYSSQNNYDDKIKSSQKVAEGCNKVANMLICNNCNKTYKSTAGLWKHKKTCSFISNETSIVCQDNNVEDEPIMTDKELVMYLLKENSDFKNMIMKLVEKVEDTSHHNNNTITNNSHNKAFNLNFFLNETCKNAMNISDFVESLQPQLCDLECIGDLGYVEGISKIILKSLKALDETERPIHCTDKKRESFYVKNDDKWEKEDEHKTHIRKAIKNVADKNTMLVPQWKAKYPDYKDSTSIYSDKYNNMIIEVLGGDDNTEQSENKIIRKIAKEVVIDKQS